jgi:transposase
MAAWARRRKTSQALALRSRIILACADGTVVSTVAAELGISRTTAGKWRSRFLAARLKGLSDEQRPGRPRTVTDEHVEKVITATLEQAPPGGDTHWSTRDLASGSVIAQPYRRHRHQEFLRFLKLIDGAVPKDLDLHLVLDNYATHKTPEIQKWLLRHPRVHLHFTPTSSSWLNLVERWFAELTNRKLRRSAHRSVTELETDIRKWINEWNKDPKPFVWTKSADEILETLAAYCERINDSGH